MQQLQPNTTLQGGKYKIIRVLGQGGFGITYLAVQTSLSRMVAVKEFFMRDYSYRADGVSAISAPTSESALKMELYRKKFIKEAHNLARIRHPNIISVIEVFEENGTVYYSMPYMSGGSLQNYVASNGQLAENTAMHYIRQIARALKYMHEEEHICHYDVKPSNILLDDKGNAILIDFGISKNYDSSGHETSTTPIGLSEGYAPIEQYQQNVDEFSPASDVYALGATLYFLLHGRKPVSAIQRASGSSLLMSTYLSQGVKDIINASMKISKQERAQSVDVFLQVTSSPYSYAPHHHSPSFEERTYTAGSSGAYTQDLSQMNSTHSQNRPQQSKSSDGFSGLWTFLAIAGAILLGIILFAVFSSNNQAQTEQVGTNSTEEVFINSAEQTQETQETAKDIYKERVEQFCHKQNGIVASFPNDKRYSVYYSKKDEYGRKFLYHYDAIADRSEKIDLPIEATNGEYTNIWVTRNRYIFIAAEYRYTDFIRIDTETNQIKYITDCSSVKRTSKGFTVVKSECINEYSATCEADKEYAFTDYYYNEEGINIGQGQQYR